MCPHLINSRCFCCCSCMGQKSERGRLLNATLGEPEKEFVFWRASLLPGEMSHGFTQGMAHWFLGGPDKQHTAARVSETLGVEGPTASVRELGCAPFREAGLMDFCQRMGLRVASTSIFSRETWNQDLSVKSYFKMFRNNYIKNKRVSPRDGQTKHGYGMNSAHELPFWAFCQL